MKSLGWYSPKYFKAHGYQVPTTWAALMSLSARIAKSGGNVKPWCGGIGSGTASGSPATDWLEEVVLGEYGAKVYADWISHKVKFDSPQILHAMTIVHNWMQNAAWVNGGFGNVQSIASTQFQNAGYPIQKIQCAMLQQASFYEAQWPKGTTVGPTVTSSRSSFPRSTRISRPPSKAAASRDGVLLRRGDTGSAELPVEPAVGGQPDQGRAWLGLGEREGGPEPLRRPNRPAVGEVSRRPERDLRFRRVGAMPAAVGAGQERKSMVNWFSNPTTPVATIAKQIDAAWPSS